MLGDLGTPAMHDILLKLKIHPSSQLALSVESILAAILFTAWIARAKIYIYLYIWGYFVSSLA